MLAVAGDQLRRKFSFLPSCARRQAFRCFYQVCLFQVLPVSSSLRILFLNVITRIMRSGIGFHRFAVDSSCSPTIWYGDCHGFGSVGIRYTGYDKVPSGWVTDIG